MKILSYILSPIFFLIFFALLVIFHPLQWVAKRLFGYEGHKVVVDILNICLSRSMLLIGVQILVNNKYKLPKKRTLIFVSNHQGTSDIPPLGMVFRKHYPKFVAKIDLGKSVPSVSFNLREGGAALINRKDPKKAITELEKFSKQLNKNKWSAIIFPEGTRSKNGKPKKFASNGLKIITKYNPDALVVPVTINNSWKIFKYGKFPCGIFSPFKIMVHQPIEVNSIPFDELLTQTETVIKQNII